MMYKPEKLVSEKTVRNKTVAGILFFILFIGVSYASWRWLQHQPKVEGALKPLRTGLDINENIFTAFFSTGKASKSFGKNLAAPKVRVNGDAGLEDNSDTLNWKLKIAKAPGDTFFVTLDELKSLPKTEVIFDFKCIEGWSQITHWGGVKFSDFLKKYNLTDKEKLKYAGLVTPNGKYYVGVDFKSMLQSQTILCYEMNGQPLPLNQGYPLRLIIPVKYGVKHLKRIGTISFSNERPKDYWYERGYDYYCGF